MSNQEHLINTGLTFKGCYIFVMTNTPGVAGKLRKSLEDKFIDPVRDILGADMRDLPPWEDPLEARCPL